MLKKYIIPFGVISPGENFHRKQILNKITADIIKCTAWHSMKFYYTVNFNLKGGEKNSICSAMHMAIVSKCMYTLSLY